MVQDCILDKIKLVKGFDARTYIGHHHLKIMFGSWLRQTKGYRLKHKDQSPYRELWQATLISSEIIHIEGVLSRDFAGDSPTIRPSPTWTITHTPLPNVYHIPPRMPTHSSPTLRMPSPDLPSDAMSDGEHSAIRSIDSIDQGCKSNQIFEIFDLI